MADKEAARAGLDVARHVEMGDTQLWTRVNSLDSPWGLDDITTVVSEVGHKIDVIMVPKVEEPKTSTTSIACSLNSKAKAHLERPILVHAILETARSEHRVDLRGVTASYKAFRWGPPTWQPIAG